jgi:hypothetical protein
LLEREKIGEFGSFSFHLFLFFVLYIFVTAAPKLTNVLPTSDRSDQSEWTRFLPVRTAQDMDIVVCLGEIVCDWSD